MSPVLAVIGGGRWGQLALSILANMTLPYERVVAISQVNSAAVLAKIDELAPSSSVTFEHVATLNEALEKYDIQAAIVVNAAQQHFQTAQQLINQGIHVLIEKPIVLSLVEMQALIDDATEKNVCLVPGLSYRFCSYLKNFSNEMFSKGAPRRFSFKWVDASTEVRYGQIKKHDASINVVQDVMPHIWTVLSTVFRSQNIHIENCVLLDEIGSHAIVTVSIKGIHGEIVLERNGSQRERCLTVQLDNESVMLDFTVEPKQTPTPLTLQLEYFFSVIASGKSVEDDLRCSLESVTCSEKASFLLEKNKHQKALPVRETYV